ncbi:TetR/AcrR family transcriptional regulator [Rhodospirillum rubrum]|uniref:Transcriptional regulator, TetR family n=1 Tax=Rhodospirillum rubrum (strain ATCC 11170 / ATH 1.1.1 / DSM 467 / LMG 4362 / NCIMB 8255 / S1) TaxID=269796 RepID=Q2RVC8_RHORT|nr:TetR/AcrR family transcriptional regulator [Rhodospirillum rubrum]ABC21917.1 transcriptional regulator, TetR family [Rhodospirillum rubrum ATCC 11170]AEO47620.1 TetR family transcriptional regulator [Rhodospirillum rubrum F11]MBK5953484.1 TetR family transcriptional regulator [Rhodospirillum rubrum]QXG81575.1 TetR/AcrR family transcriptional regulator [Rhodospirillum rubrum]HAP98448.1 TetR/AcrR family transcriptional regulator [Rhodospirillum rubrum]
MTRGRRITSDDILEAVERVVLRLGAAGLSIDAVAQEAGVSKSRVVYDHKSKSALLEALIERHIELEDARIGEAMASARDTPHPELFARIAVAEPEFNEIDKAVAMAISASVTNEDRLQTRLREWTRKDLAAVTHTDRPEAGLLAYLALCGFYWIELGSFLQWSPDERSRVLEGIRKVFTSYPEP